MSYNNAPQQQYQGQFNAPQNNNDPFSPCSPDGKCRGVAALLAILIGSLGIQYFYVGKTTAGLLTILISLVTCGLFGVIMFIQGILMFCMTNDQFRQKYIDNPSNFPIF